MTEILLAPVEVEQLYELVAPEVPCEYINGEGVKCNDEAKWIVWLKPHCVGSVKLHRLYCDDCMNQVKGGELWKCRICGSFALINRFIVKIEPL